MNQSDKSAFKELFDGLAEYYRKDKLGKIALQIYFGALESYSFEQVRGAISKHILDASEGQFFPQAAHIRKHLEGGEITADMMIAAARLHNTPMGILAYIHIGTWDLDSNDAFYLRQRGEECLQLLPGWKKRALAGEYSNHEISVMIKYSVDPTAPFAEGFMPPANAPALAARAERISTSPRHLEFMKPIYKPELEDNTPDLDNKELNSLVDKLLIEFDE